MWQIEAKCDATNTNLFFSTLPSKVAKAKALCNECSVSNECLEFALNEEIEFGIFGGTTPEDRKQLVSN